jgi:hypothetical protein
MSGRKIEVGDKAAEIVVPTFIHILFFIRCDFFHPQPIYHPLRDLSSNVQFDIHCAIYHPLVNSSSAVDETVFWAEII